MYGSIHTHFESRYDTGNDKVKMVKNFIANGAKRVAVTEHGVFSSYEDLRDIAGKMKKKACEIRKRAEKEGVSFEISGASDISSQTMLANNINLTNPAVTEEEWNLLLSNPSQSAYLLGAIDEFEIIPGVEGYFGENGAHLILVAKDYEGYLSLCKIISESNRNVVKEKPIITLENLEKNVRRGHVICTSACIAGPFGHILGLDRINLEEKINSLDEDLTKSGYREYVAVTEEYERIRKLAKATRPTKKDVADAEKIKKKTGNQTLLDEIDRRTKEADDLDAWVTQNMEENKKAETQLKKMNRAVYARKQSNLETYTEELNKIKERESNGEMEMDAHILLEKFINIFGKDNFYFELQNHGLKQEQIVYNNVVSFANRAEHPRFIASNDIHVGVRKDDPEYEDMLLRRNVIKYTRFNTYEKESADDREYTIKNDKEISEELAKIISDDETIAQAVRNIRTALEPCHVEFVKENHYPKFCEDENAEFEKRVREGIAIKFPNGFPDKKYEERLEYELGVIKNMGYAGYHLIVADYLAYGRLLGYLPTAEEIENAPMSVEELDAYITEKGYPRIGYNIGPGRGSAVGSLCCYLLGITDIDPIPYGLLFERFLNVERVSMPDIDSDFRTDIRAKVIDYCRSRYGAECICQIMTKSYGATKGNLRLAARYLGAIECESNPRYKELENELSEVKYMISSNPDIKAEKDKLSSAISDVKKAIRTEKDEDKKEDLQAELESLEDSMAELGVAAETAKNDFKARKEEIVKEMDSFLKTWYARADKLAKSYDDTTESFPDEDSFTEEERAIVELAETLDGVFTGYGQHAAGTIISGDDVTDVLPLMWNSEKGAMETQCTMAQAEAKGLLKMDFLNLKNLNIITDIIRHPTKKADMDGTLQDYSKRDEMLKDPAIYRDIFWTGLTQGIFQFESPGMKKMLTDFRPESFEDIILLVAAYRPGPMQYLPEIIAQKKYDDGRSSEKPEHKINIKNEALNEILGPTYGCIIYQEQVMQIFQNLAGYSLGGADLVRRAMSKKHLEELVPERAAFIHGDPQRNIEGCVKKQGISEKEANDLFDQMMDFAKYAFNKSHATAYAMVAMFTAYLKKYHTADFFRSSLNATEKLEEIPDFVKEMPYFGIEFKCPSMMESRNAFSVQNDGKEIRYGLKYVKGFSEQNVHRTSTIQEFLEMNPDVSLKVAEKYAQLGMFKECWTSDKRSERVHGNRHECLRWLKENGNVFKKYQEYVEKTDSISLTKAELEGKLFQTETPEEEAALKKELNKVSSQLSQWTAKRKELAGILNTNRDADKAKGKVPKETSAEVLENREWEIEMLSIPFDISESLSIIRNCENKCNFDALNKSIDDNNGANTVRIPAVVLSVSGEKKTKKSQSTYYDVMLMDRNKNIITRRFDSKPTLLEGEFAIVLDECKYYTCKTKNAKRLYGNNLQKNQYLSSNASSSEKINALRTGGHVEQVWTPGRRSGFVITNNNKDAEADEEREP